MGRLTPFVIGTRFGPDASLTHPRLHFVAAKFRENAKGRKKLRGGDIERVTLDGPPRLGSHELILVMRNNRF